MATGASHILQFRLIREKKIMWSESPSIDVLNSENTGRMTQEQSGWDPSEAADTKVFLVYPSSSGLHNNLRP